MFLEIEVRPTQFETDELIEELESRGYDVLKEDDISEAAYQEEQLENLKDCLHAVYRDFLLWKDFGMKDSSFEQTLIKFFDDTLDEKVVD